MTKLQEFISNIAVLDTETTGVEKDDDIIEFSISYPSKVHEHIDTIDNYTSRYKPLKSIPPEASAVHFISDEDVVGCFGYNDDLANIDALMGARTFYVGHNVQFDRRMMMDNENKYRNTISQYLIDENKWICTLRLAKKMFSEDMEFKNLTLSYLWYKFGCYREVDRKVNAHSARDDVFMCYQVLMKLVEVAIERGHVDPNKDIGSQIVDYCNSPMLYKVMPFGKHKGEEMRNVPLNYIQWMITNSDILDTTNPNCDKDLVFTFEYEYNTRTN